MRLFARRENQERRSQHQTKNVPNKKQKSAPASNTKNIRKHNNKCSTIVSGGRFLGSGGVSGASWASGWPQEGPKSGLGGPWEARNDKSRACGGGSAGLQPDRRGGVGSNPQKKVVLKL